MDEQAQQARMIACNLTARELATRLDELARGLFGSAVHVEELPDGFAYRFGGGTEVASQLTTFVLEERQCCPFFHFDLHFEPYAGPITLALRGTPEVKAYMKLLAGNGPMHGAP
jgi:hypothetical protein